MLEHVSKQVIERWPELFEDRPVPRRVHYLGLPGSIEGRTTTFLGFADGGTRPAFVVKLFRDRGDSERADVEARVLGTLAASAIARTVPAVLLRADVYGVPVLVESFKPGRPMTARLDGNGPALTEAEQNLGVALEWLVLMRDAMRAHPSPPRGASAEHSSNVFQRCLSLFTLGAAERRYIASAGESLVGQRFESLARHGDFVRHNILLRDEGISVVDWSDASEGGLPLHDALGFATTYVLHLRRRAGLKGFVEAFDATFLEPGPLASLVARHLRGHCARIDLDPSSIEVLLVAFLAERAVLEHERVTRAAEFGSLPRATLALAAEAGLDAAEAFGGQFWIALLRHLAQRHEGLVAAC